MERGKKRRNYKNSASFRRKDWKKNTAFIAKGRHQKGYRHPEKNKRNLRKSGGRVSIRLPPKEQARSVAVGLLVTGGIAFVFYRSVWALSLGILMVPLFVRRGRRRWENTRSQRLQQQFVSGMQIVSGSLAAGYSMENAWRQALPELIRLYGENAELCIEMRQMNQRLDMNEPLERILPDFAKRAGVEDISNFTEIFRYAKRSGGNLNEIIRTTVGRMQEKAEILAEIENAVAAKKMEQRMMTVLLPGVLLFVTLSSPSYVGSLYHNALGILVMSVCLAGYGICCFWSEKIMDIVV